MHASNAKKTRSLVMVTIKRENLVRIVQDVEKNAHSQNRDANPKDYRQQKVLMKEFATWKANYEKQLAPYRKTTDEQVELLRSLWHEFTNSNKTLQSVETAYLQISEKLRLLVLTTDDEKGRQEIWASIKGMIEAHKKNKETVSGDTNEATAVSATTKFTDQKRASKRGLDNKTKPRKPKRVKAMDFDTQVKLTDSFGQHPPQPSHNITSPEPPFTTNAIRQPGGTFVMSSYVDSALHPSGVGVFKQMAYNATEAPSIQSESSPNTTLMQSPNMEPYISDFMSPLGTIHTSSSSIYHPPYAQNYPETFSHSTGQSRIGDNVDIVPSQGGNCHEEGGNEGW
ncbi:5523_t:CDS:2 [Paraglomus brasilianum]|uniref:5523_t:CDS:1 n=1 Tax=Paraglomus brasilianum TaxID=144538 RepID=A0A9N8Z390_9GLOM|nr:5523_t:CDS:2 [Paraglomus brasilianum]